MQFMGMGSSALEQATINIGAELHWNNQMEANVLKVKLSNAIIQWKDTGLL